VIDALRAFLNRPLPDAERRRLFVAAMAVILAGAGALALLAGPAPRPQRATHTPSRVPAAAPPVVVLPTQDTPSPQTPNEEGTPRNELEGSAADIASAKRAAKRFLAGYLPYTYGQRRAGRIVAASDALRRRLAARPPRVPARERHRRPHVVLVQSNGVGRERAELVALIRDGTRRYTVPLELTRGRARWTITAVGS
jgi:hypothetical protein